MEHRLGYGRIGHDALPPPSGSKVRTVTSRRKNASNRSFGILLSVAFSLIAAVKFRIGASSFPLWAALGILFLIVALLVPRLLRPIKSLWLRLGHLLGRVLTPIFLILVYVISIVPVGLLLKAFRKDSLHLSRDPNGTSYWILREPPGPPPASFTNQF